jgi:hypothetical protein
MPIGTGDSYQVYLNRYEEIIKPAVDTLVVDGEAVFKCVRADFVSRTGSITRDVLSRLYRADAVIADLTDLNPNVFYELGVRHALRSGTVLVAIKGTKPPFDVGDLRVISYEDRVGGEKVAIPQIQDALRSVLAESTSQDSPVLHAIPQLASRRPASELEANIAALEQQASVLRAQLEVSERSNLASQGTLEALRQAVESLTSDLPKRERKEAEEKIESEAKAREALQAPVVPPPGVDVDPMSVFVVMPMNREFESIFEIIMETALKLGLRAFRADTIATAGRIIDQVFEAIAKSGLIVADLTGRNQNVMYELGVASTMGKETLLMSQSLEDVPFDIRQYRVLVYKPTLAGASDLRAQLERSLRDYAARQRTERLTSV